VRNELKIGWILLLAVILVFGFLSWLKRSIFTQQYLTCEIHFQDVSGLNKGDPVSLMGREIGYVQDFRSPAGDTLGWIVITQLDPEIQIYHDANASLRLREITGGRVIDINRGSNTSSMLQGVIPGYSAWDAGMALQEIQKIVELTQDSAFRYMIHNAAGFLQKMNNTDVDKELSNVVSILHHTQTTLQLLQPLLKQLQSDTGMQAVLVKTMMTMQTIQSLADSVKPVLSSQLFQSAANTLDKTDSLILATRTFLNTATPVLNALTPQSGSTAHLLLQDVEFKKQLQLLTTRLDSVLLLIQQGKIKARVRF
jgi:ABC-type transporter Mla subunit MlaD